MLVFTGFEEKSAQIEPSSSTHALVDMEFGPPAGMIHRVVCVIYRIGQACVAYIHGVVSAFRQIRCPRSLCARLVATRSGDAT